MKRHAGSKERARSIELFSASRVLKDLKGRSTSLENIALLYEMTIDHGAHPNIRSVVGQTESEVDEEHERATLNLHILSAGTFTQFTCMVVSAEVGLEVVGLLADVFPQEAAAAEVPKQIERGWQAVSPLLAECRRRLGEQ